MLRPYLPLFLLSVSCSSTIGDPLGSSDTPRDASAKGVHDAGVLGVDSGREQGQGDASSSNTDGSTHSDVSETAPEAEDAASPTPVPDNDLVPSAKGAAVVFQAPDPVQPGQVALLFGAQIGAEASVMGWQLPDVDVGAPPLQLPHFRRDDGLGLTMAGASDLSAKALIPTAFRGGLFALRIHNSVGWSETIVLNRPKINFFVAEPGGRARAGGELRVLGKNFGDHASAWLVMGNESHALRTTRSSDYDAAFTVPQSLPDGSYRLFIHSGHGGAYGFSDAVTVPLAPAAAPWPTTRYDVRSLGAKGDGATDDTAAFQSALRQAGDNGGGIVWVPKGVYAIRALLSVPARVIVRGESRAETKLITSDPLVSLIAGTESFRIEDLSFQSGVASRILSCPDDPKIYNDYGVPTLDRTCRDVQLTNLDIELDGQRLRNGEPFATRAVVLLGEDIVLARSTLANHGGIPLSLNSTRRVVIADNVFLPGGGIDTGPGVDDYKGGGWVETMNLTETIVERNEIHSLPGEHGNCTGVLDEAYKLYYTGNFIHDCRGTYGESLTFDTEYYPEWLGTPSSYSGSSFSKAKAFVGKSLNRVAAVVVAGKGLGQRRLVTGHTDDSITLESPFDITPDDGSLVAVLTNKADVVIAHNRFANTTVMVQLYTQSYGFIIDGNEGDQTGGTYCMGWDFMENGSPPRRKFSICYFNQWLGNTLRGEYSRSAISGHAMTTPHPAVGTLVTMIGRNSQLDTPPGITHIGNIVRGTHISGGGSVLGGYSDPPDLPSTPPSIAAPYLARDTLFEGNRIDNSPRGLAVYPHYLDTVLHDNQATQCAEPVVDRGTGTVSLP